MNSRLEAGQAAPALPPCVVLGLETQIGLSLVRELGAAGVPVIGIAHDPDAIGLRSRHLARGIVVPEGRSAALLETLRALGDELGPCPLLAVSESNLTWLNSQRPQLGALRPAIPQPEQLAWVLDKHRTLRAAAAVGIEVPHSVQPTSIAQARALAADFPFPAVLKWADPHAVSGRLRALGLPLLKAEHCLRPQQWLAVAERYAPLGAWPLVQRYCPGRGLGQFFFMHRGQAVRRFQHLRVAEWPPEGGFSSVCDAVPLHLHADLQERSIALLQRIGWEGVAMVEYRWDAATGRAALMEINGRFWGSHPLAVHCGAGFALLAYHSAAGLPLPDLPPPRDDLRCRMVATELKRLWRIALQPGRIVDPNFKRRPVHELWRFCLDFLRPRVAYYVWLRSDPWPLWADIRAALKRPARRRT